MRHFESEPLRNRLVPEVIDYRNRRLQGYQFSKEHIFEVNFRIKSLFRRGFIQHLSSVILIFILSFWLSFVLLVFKFRNYSLLKNFRDEIMIIFRIVCWGRQTSCLCENTICQVKVTFSDVRDVLFGVRMAKMRNDYTRLTLNQLRPHLLHFCSNKIFNSFAIL